MEAYTNSKSSTGRIDLATRVLADGSSRYDRIPAGYDGELWLELIPRSFNVVAEAGGQPQPGDLLQRPPRAQPAGADVRHARAPLLCDADGGAVAGKSCIFDAAW